MRRFLTIGLGVVLVFSFGLGGCKKKEEQPVPKAPQMTPGGQMPPPGHGEGMGIQKTELKTVVPDSVKGKWSAVKIMVEDKTSKKTEEYTINLNSEFKIPNSDLKLAVGDFLPDFKMDAGMITSTSNMPNNPAVGIKVFEGDKEVFKGWLYSKFPTIHPFEHPKFGLALKEGVKKG
ncbi:MAG TPA: hypothetical protein VFG09_08820 [Thermodesulfovibrionales bacterium]|nr:hypothetical protein [Thermodesulfovibrionales bacterium]